MLASAKELALGTEFHRSSPASTNMFSDEMKSSKKNNCSSSAVDEPEPPSTRVKEPEVVETSINKKKKKSNRTTNEEDDLDKILAELVQGEGPVPPTAPHVQETVQTQSEPTELLDAAGEMDGEGEVVESVAAKKKRKKKEKEKEKKAAVKAVATPSVELKHEETKGKVPDKKVPKHVREMQESLARRKEAEEKKKEEEEEKLWKEEEERLWQEELQRLADEKKQLKKEREKEKRIKKKAEGKLLTEKQKEDARQREARRIKILADYQAKKSKQHPLANGIASAKDIESTETKENHEDNVSELDSLEQEKIEEVEEMKMEEKSDVTEMSFCCENDKWVPCIEVLPSAGKILIIGSNPEEQQKMVGRHFDIKEENLSKEDLKLLEELKEMFKIQ